MKNKIKILRGIDINPFGCDYEHLKDVYSFEEMVALMKQEMKNSKTGIWSIEFNDPYREEE